MFNSALFHELQTLAAEDQAVRSPLHPNVEIMREVDLRNTVRMKEIVDVHGWPGRSLVGEEGSNYAWLLVQHADFDVPFQERVLELMALSPLEVYPPDFALLQDRVLVNTDRDQRFGSQFREEGGILTPHPIEDPENVDARRHSVGLSSMSEYAASMSETYGRPTKL